MIRLAVVLMVGLAACSHPPMKQIAPGQVIVAGDATLTTREGNAIEVSVTRALGDHHAEGRATLHGITVEDAKTSRFVAVAKGRAWFAIATALASEPPLAYDAALRGIDELGTDYRAKRDGKLVIDDTGQTLMMAKMAAGKGDHAGAAADATKVLRLRIDLYVRAFAGAVE